MPSFDVHCDHSRHNLEFLNSFFLSRFNDWAITVMFYTVVHMVEAILNKDHSIDSKSHLERSDNILKLAKFPIKSYKSLRRKAQDSRYKGYMICGWEIHLIFKNDFQILVTWFNEQVKKDQVLNIQICENLDCEWLKKFKEKDTDCNKCC